MQLRNRNVVSSTPVFVKTVYKTPSKRVSIRRCDTKPTKKNVYNSMNTCHGMMQLRNRCVELNF